MAARFAESLSRTFCWMSHCREGNSQTEMSVISPDLYAVWSGSRVVVFNNRQILGLAICRDTTPDPVQ